MNDRTRRKTSEVATRHSMTDRLAQVLVCSPQVAGWGDPVRVRTWMRLGFHQPPRCDAAVRQHAALCGHLEDCGVEVNYLSEDKERLSLDAVYAHDASLPTRWGMIVLRPAKSNRRKEGEAHRVALLSLGFPILGELSHQGYAEAGDMLWIDQQTLLVGRGYRTNREGIRQIRALLEPKGISVVTAPLPHGSGPESCLHLMSLISLLAERTALVDLRWLAVDTVEFLRTRGFRLLEMEESERETLACNILSINGNQLLALEENVNTNRILSEEGFEVLTFPGSEVAINGSGGPTCLTRPLRRCG